jgi:magnesium-protoporphyrin IX monomethyl ester (oxidative) cyclase
MCATTRPTEYDYTVFRITSEICRQVFPLTLDIDHPAFRAGLERMRRITVGLARARARGGLMGGLQRLGLTAAAAVTFARLFLLPAKGHALPARVRMAAAW